MAQEMVPRAFGTCFRLARPHTNPCVDCAGWRFPFRMFDSMPNVYDLTDRIVTVENAAGMQLQRIDKTECGISSLQTYVASMTVAVGRLRKRDILDESGPTAGAQPLTAALVDETPLWTEGLPAPAPPPASHRGPGTIPAHKPRSVGCLGAIWGSRPPSSPTPPSGTAPLR